MTNPHAESKPEQHPPEQELTGEDARILTDTLRMANENCARLMSKYNALLAAYEDRSKAFERAAADCVRLEGENAALRDDLELWTGDYLKLEGVARAEQLARLAFLNGYRNWVPCPEKHRAEYEHEFYRLATRYAKTFDEALSPAEAEDGEAEG